MTGLEQPHHFPHGLIAHTADVGADGGQHGFQTGRHLRIVKSGDQDILAHTHSTLLEHVIAADAHFIVGKADCLQVGVHIQQFPNHLFRGFGEVAVDHLGAVVGNVVRLQRRAVAVQPIHGILVSHRTGNIADLPAAVALDQMLYRQLHPVRVEPDAGIAGKFHFHGQQRQRIVGMQELAHFVPADIRADRSHRDQQSVQVGGGNIVVDHIVLIIIDRILLIIFYGIDSPAGQQDQIDVQFFRSSDRTFQYLACIFIFQMVYHQTDLEPFLFRHDSSPLRTLPPSLSAHRPDGIHGNTAGISCAKPLCGVSLVKKRCADLPPAYAGMPDTFDSIYKIRFVYFCSIAHST